MRPSSHSRSFAFIRGLLVTGIIPLAGCSLLPSKQAAAPPPPKPAVTQPPAPEPQLSIPQTAVVLPSAQPVNEAGIPEPPPVQTAATEKVETPPAPRPVRRVPAPPKPEPETEAETPAAPAVEPQPVIQTILSDEAQRTYRAKIDTRKKEIGELLGRAQAHPSTSNQPLSGRIVSFVTQSDEAAKRGDYVQADALSERALILARELQVE